MKVSSPWILREVTSIFLYAVCEVGNSRERGGVDEGVGGVGVLTAAGFGGDDGLVVGPHVGAGKPDGVC